MQIDEVILVDGNLHDQTIAVSHAIRPDIRVVGQQRPGKGAALRAGFEAVRGDSIDADRSMDPGAIGRFLAALDEDHDLVKGSRFMEDGGTSDMKWVRRCGNAARRGLANSLCRTGVGAQFGFRQPPMPSGIAAPAMREAPPARCSRTR